MQGGKNSEISWGGGLTYKEKGTGVGVVDNLKEKVVGSLSNESSGIRM